jgi:dodecin
MSVAKVVELIADSPKSWEDATNEALQMASKTLIAHLDVKKPTTLPTHGRDYPTECRGTISAPAGVGGLDTRLRRVDALGLE